MERSRPGIGAELVPVTLILASLVGTLGLVIAVHKRHMREESARAKAVAVLVIPPRPPKTPDPQPIPVPEPEPEPEPEPKPAPAPPAPIVLEDPTPKAVAKLEAEEASEKSRSAALNQRISSRLLNLRTEEEKASSFRHKVLSIQSKIESLAERVEQLEMEAAKTSIEADVLERQREQQKEIAQRVSSGSSYAILPHKGPNGTWRRPIVMECHDGQVTVRPNGPSFGLGELLQDVGFGNTTFRGLVAREAIRIQRGATPDGHTVVPYFYFLVRPDGIKSYYAARRQLEPLGIAFGYELADADWEVEYPDLDNPDNWQIDALNKPQDSLLADKPAAGGGHSAPTREAGPGSGADENDPFVWRGKPSVGAAGGGGASLPGERPLGPVALGPAPPGTSPAFPGGRPNSPDFGPTGLPGNDLKSGEEPGSLPPGFLNGAGNADTGPESGLSPRGGGNGDLGSTGGFTGSRGGTNLPPGVAEEIASRPDYQRAWARELARRGITANPDGVAPKDFGSIGEYMARQGIVPPNFDLRGGGGLPASAAPADKPPGASGVASGEPGQPSLPGGVQEGRSHYGQNPSGGGLGGAPGQMGNPSRSQSNQGANSNSGQQAGANSNAGQAGGASSGSGSGTASGSAQPGRGIPGQTGGGPGSGIDLGSSRYELYELVVACEARGVAIHPGDYRVTLKGLSGKEPLLASQLRAVVRDRQEARGGKIVVPTLKFLVEPGGQATYAKARAQIALDGIDWPASMQISGGDLLRGLAREEW